MNILQNDIAFMSKVELNSVITSDIMSYKVLPKFGLGKLNIVKLIPGLFLTYNDLKIKSRVLANETPQNNKPYIKIDYCINGSYRFEFNDKLIGIVKRGNIIFYTGINYFSEVEYSDNTYNSFSLMCYLNELDNTLTSILNISLDEVWNFYKHLDKRKSYLITNTNLQNTKVLNQLVDMQKIGLISNLGLLKLRALELFLLEVKSYKSYQDAINIYYPKNTIKKIEVIKDFIEQNLTEHYKIDDLAQKHKIGKTKLKECFKHVYGVGPYSYLKNYRMKQAKELLNNSDFNILEIANQVGYSSPSKFGVAFKRIYGVNPLKYRKSNKN